METKRISKKEITAFDFSKAKKQALSDINDPLYQELLDSFDTEVLNKKLQHEDIFNVNRDNLSVDSTYDLFL